MTPELSNIFLYRVIHRISGAKRLVRVIQWVIATGERSLGQTIASSYTCLPLYGALTSYHCDDASLWDNGVAPRVAANIAPYSSGVRIDAHRRMGLDPSGTKRNGWN